MRILSPRGREERSGVKGVRNTGGCPSLPTTTIPTPIDHHRHHAHTNTHTHACVRTCVLLFSSARSLAAPSSSCVFSVGLMLRPDMFLACCFLVVDSIRLSALPACCLLSRSASAACLLACVSVPVCRDGGRWGQCMRGGNPHTCVLVFGASACCCSIVAGRLCDLKNRTSHSPHRRPRCVQCPCSRAPVPIQGREGRRVRPHSQWRTKGVGSGSRSQACVCVQVEEHGASEGERRRGGGGSALGTLDWSMLAARRYTHTLAKGTPQRPSIRFDSIVRGDKGKKHEWKQ